MSEDLDEVLKGYPERRIVGYKITYGGREFDVTVKNATLFQDEVSEILSGDKVAKFVPILSGDDQFWCAISSGASIISQPIFQDGIGLAGTSNGGAKG
jgi:hypothetical protein